MSLFWIIATAVVATMCFMAGVYENSAPLLALGIINGYLTAVIADKYSKIRR